MINRISKLRHEQGFTLVELLIVIVILGILAAVVVFAVGGISDTGEESACRATAKTVESASEAFRANNDDYASQISDGDETTNSDDLVPDYMREPEDGTLNAAGTVITLDGGTVTYNGSTGAVTAACS
jgi:prepilin-type N-terminal cleavage/methylation domain-containing protein